MCVYVWIVIIPSILYYFVKDNHLLALFSFLEGAKRILYEAGLTQEEKTLNFKVLHLFNLPLQFFCI